MQVVLEVRGLVESVDRGLGFGHFPGAGQLHGVQDLQLQVVGAHREAGGHFAFQRRLIRIE